MLLYSFCFLIVVNTTYSEYRVYSASLLLGSVLVLLLGLLLSLLLDLVLVLLLRLILSLFILGKLPAFVLLSLA